MNQEITLSENIFKYLYQEINHSKNIYESGNIIEYYSEPSKHKIICANIEHNLIVADENKELLNVYIKVIDSLENDNSKEITERIFEHWIHNRVIFRQITNQNYEKNKNLLDLVVCNESDDKILFEPFDDDYNKKRLKINFDFGNEIEIHNTNSFLNPEHSHRLKNIPTEINLKKGEKYDLAKILEPFLKEAERVEFHDPYLKNKAATESLLKVLGICKKAKKIVLRIAPGKMDSNPIMFEKFQEKLKEYSKIVEYEEYPIIITKDGKEIIGHKERYIITDEYDIYIPGGLDQFLEDGKYRGDKAELTVKKKKN